MRRILSGFLAAGITAMALCQTVTGKQAIGELNKFSREEIPAGSTRDVYMAKLAEKAKLIIGDLKPETVPADEAADWAQVFQAAGRADDSLTLNRKAYQYIANSARVVQENLVAGLIRQEKFDELLAVLKRPIDLGGPAVIGQLSESIRYGLDKYRTTRPELLNQCYDLLLAQISLENPITANDKNWEPYVYSAIQCLKYELMLDAGKKAEAVKGLKSLRTKMQTYPNSKNALGQSATHPIDVLLKKAELADALAPEITVDAKLGDFPGLKAWRGKVVIVDFFAHWCGPCIRSFPTLRQYQTDYKDKGLEVVGVTSYYGYYGQTQGVAKANELELVKTKFVPQHQMTWPVVFDTKQATQAAFGVGAIPHLVVVDRKGKIRRVEVGFNPAHEADIRKLIEACLAEK